MIYISEDLKVRERVYGESVKIERELLSFFHETEEIMAVIGKEMAKSHPNDFIHIWRRLRDAFAFTETSKTSFRWPDFGWINLELQQVVNTKHGVLETRRDMSIREYTSQASQLPFKLLFAKKGMSIPMDFPGRWIIPVGMGVIDDQEVFLGIVAGGLYLSEMAKKIDQIIYDHSVEYVLLDQTGDVVLETVERQLNENPKLLGDLRYRQQGGKHFTTIAYSELKEIANTPYTLITYMDWKIVQREYQKKIIPRLLKFFGGSFLCLVLLYICLNKRLNQNKELENSKKQLEDALKLAASSDTAKEDLLKKIRQDLKGPYNTLATYTELLLKYIKKKIDLDLSVENKIYFLERIKEAVINLNTLTTSVLDLSNVNVGPIIENCIKIHAKEAWTRGVYLEKDVALVPSIYVDELRFTQVIVGLIARAIRFTRKGERIFFGVSIHTENNREFLKILVKDQGIGLEEEELQKIATKFDVLRVSRRTDGTDLELPAIEKLVQMHLGKCVIAHQWQVGTTITIFFPYRTKAECLQLINQSTDIQKSSINLCDWNSFV